MSAPDASGPAPGGLAVTWWGHASATLELGAVRVATDPLLSGRLFHLVRTGPLPRPAATVADLVVVSHLHHDHLHVPSLRRFPPDVPVVVPRGAVRAVPALAGLRTVEVAPGDRVQVAGVDVEALPADHDGRRHNWSRRSAPALGFRFAAGGRTVWYSGDTGVRDRVAPAHPATPSAPVDLALVAIGGWGPTLGEGHLSPTQAAALVDRLGARWALAVHYGTFWPVAMQRVNAANHRRLFLDPPAVFAAAVREHGPVTSPLTPPVGERLVLADEASP